MPSEAPFRPSIRTLGPWAAAFLLCATPPDARAADPVDPIFADGFEAGPCRSEICDSLDNDCNGVIDNDCVHCSPLDPNALCGPNSHCTPQLNGDSTCSRPAGAGLQGQPCSSSADCAGSFVCLDGGAGAQCLLWCQHPSGSCPFSTSCIAFDPPVLTGTIAWGVCL